jgi:phosphomannomutase
MIKHTIDLARYHGRDAVAPAIEKIARRFADLSPDTADGVRVDFADGWVHFRASNTEPIARLIAEAATPERAWEIIDEVAVAGGLC